MSLWQKLNEATQPGVHRDVLADIATSLNFGPTEEPVLYVLKRAQRLAQMKGRAIKTEADYLYWIGQARGNLAAQFGVSR
jgi:hypothetical protein